MPPSNSQIGEAGLSPSRGSSGGAGGGGAGGIAVNFTSAARSDKITYLSEVARLFFYATLNLAEGQMLAVWEEDGLMDRFTFQLADYVLVDLELFFSGMYKSRIESIQQKGFFRTKFVGSP